MRQFQFPTKSTKLNITVNNCLQKMKHIASANTDLYTRSIPLYKQEMMSAWDFNSLYPNFVGQKYSRFTRSLNETQQYLDRKAMEDLDFCPAPQAPVMINFIDANKFVPGGAVLDYATSETLKLKILKNR